MPTFYKSVVQCLNTDCPYGDSHSWADQVKLPNFLSPKLIFLEFTSGVPHPLLSKPTMGLPLNAILDMAYAAVEVLEDYILKLKLSSSKEPHLYTVCSLELPTLEPYTFVIISMVDKEWVLTASHDASACSQLLWKHIIPFCSSKVSTISLLKEYKM
jgi:hypothetical protein